MCFEDDRGPCIGQRHILVMTSGAGLGILFSIRLSFPVALVAMVKKNVTSGAGHNHFTNDSCKVLTTNSTVKSGPLIHGEFNWPAQLQGFLLGAFFLGYLFFQIPAGGWAQRFGAKWIIFAGISWPCLLCLVIPVAARTSPYLLIAILILQGIGASVAFPALFAMFGRWVPPLESSVLTQISYIGPWIGSVVGQVMAGAVSSSPAIGGWPTVFYIHAVLGLLWALIWSCVITSSPKDNKLISEAEKDYIVSTVNSDQDAANKNGVPWCRLLTRRTLVYVFLKFCMGWLSYSLTVCMPRFLTEVLHQSVTSTGVLVSLPILSNILMMNIYSQAADAIRKRQLVSQNASRKIFTTFGFWGCGICVLSITFVDCNMIITEVLLVTAFALFSAVYVGFFLYPLDACPEYSGTIFGIGNVFMTLAGMLSPLAIGFAAADGSRQGWARLFYISFGVAATAGLMHLLFGNSERQRLDVESDEEEEPLLGEDIRC